MSEFPADIEKGAAELLCEDLNGVDDDDTIRVDALLGEMIATLEEALDNHITVMPGSGSSIADAAFLLKDMRRRGYSAGELRAQIRRQLEELAAATAGISTDQERRNR